MPPARFHADRDGGHPGHCRGIAGRGCPVTGGLGCDAARQNRAFDLYASLAYARSEAIKRNVVIDIAPRNSNLANGWQVLSGTTVLRDQTGFSGISVAGPSGTVSFDPEGRLTAAGRVDFRLTAANSALVIPRCVAVDVSGRPSIRLDRNQDGNCVNG